MKTITIAAATTNYMNENNISYSPIAFSDAMDEVRKTFVYVNPKPLTNKEKKNIYVSRMTSTLHS